MDDDDLASWLESARRAHEFAYAEVRRLLGAHELRPPIDRGSLTDRQRRALERWEAAEAEYDEVRRQWHSQRPYDKAPGPDDEERPAQPGG